MCDSGSDGSVHAHYEMEHILHGDEQVLAVIDFDIEFVLNSVVHEDTSLDADVVVLVIPMGLESDRHTIPTIWVNVTKAVTAHLDDSLGHDVRFLVQVDMVLVGIVEGAHGAN